MLVDFWTYLVHQLRASDTSSRGLVQDLRLLRPGGNRRVHTPEFAFERVIGNVRNAVRSFGVNYPVAVDDSYATWLSYGNQAWPSEYLIDQTGHLRYIKSGEGDYSQTEDPHSRPSVRRRRKASPAHRYAQSDADGANNPRNVPGVPVDRAVFRPPTSSFPKPKPYTFAPRLPLNGVSLQGVWTCTANDLISGARAQLRLRFQAKDVYAVLGWPWDTGRLSYGRKVASLRVQGYPRNYAIIKGSHLTSPGCYSSTCRRGLRPTISRSAEPPEDLGSGFGCTRCG